MKLNNNGVMLFTSDDIRKIIREELKNFSKNHNSTINFDNKRYLTRKETADYLSIALSTVDYWTRIGKLRKLSIGGTIRFDKHEIDKNIMNLHKYKI